MKRGQFMLLVVLVVISGFLGGVVSTWLSDGGFAYAQDYRDLLGKFKKKKVVVAQEFVLMDENGQICGRLYVDSNGRGQLDLHPMARKVR